MSPFNVLITLAMLSATVAILARCTVMMAHLDRRSWDGRPFAFAGFSLGVAMVAGGSVGVLLGWDGGQYLLVGGIAAWLRFNNRRSE